MIFGYIKYRPRGFVFQLLSNFKFFAFKGRPLSQSMEQMSFRPLPMVRKDRHCIQCNICIENCPTDALSYSGRDDVAINIDPSLCLPCRLCVEVCPTEYFAYKNSDHSQVRLGKRMEKFLEN